MELEQALKIIEQVSYSFMGNHSDHINIEMALTKIKEELFKSNDKK